MNFAAQIARIQSAAGHPKKLALAVLEIVMGSEPLELRRVLEAAAVLRWFDDRTLPAVLDEDLRDSGAHWLEKLKRLSAVEPASGRGGWNIHETTRRALREQLQAEHPARIAALAGRACNVFPGKSVPDRIEHAYHLALANPAGCGPMLRTLDFDLQAKPEHALAFTGALSEYLTHDAWPAATRGWAAYFAALNRSHYRPHLATLQDAEHSLSCFEFCGLEEGIACAATQLGDTLCERGLASDAERALGHYERSLEVSERLLGANPESAQAARDVMISIERLAKMRAEAGDANGAVSEQERALGIARQFWERVQSYEMGRTMAISSFLPAQYARAAGDQEKAGRYLGECFTILDAFTRSGSQLDAPMRQLHARLAPSFAPDHKL